MDYRRIMQDTLDYAETHLKSALSAQDFPCIIFTGFSNPQPACRPCNTCSTSSSAFTKYF